MLAFVIFAATFLLLLLIAIVWLYPSSRRVTSIPGLDPSTKEEGNLSDITRAGSLHEFLVDAHARFGPITGFWWGEIYVVSIASPELFKEHVNVFDRPAGLFKMFEPLIGHMSIRYANGSDGRARREKYDRAFASESLSKYYKKFQEVANSVENSWLQKGEQDHVPLSVEMFKYASKAALLCLLGESFSDEKLVQSFRNAYEKAWSEMEYRLADPVIPDESSPRIKQFKEAVRYLESAVRKVVQHRKEQNLQTRGRLLIDDIVESSPDEDVLICDVLTYMNEALHTTANLLTWCLYFLATHKDVQDKLRQEIKQVLGEEDDVSDSNLEKLKYMTQVIDETLRCAVVSPWGARVQSFDSQLGGHKVPKSTPVIHAFGVVMQDSTLWPLPNKFDPDRFNVENSKSRSPYAFVPFGFAGKRKCPGHKFACVESSVLLAALIRRFEVSLLEDQVVQPVYGLVTHPHEEIWVKVSKRH